MIWRSYKRWMAASSLATPDGGSPRVIAAMFQAFSEAVGGELVDVLVNKPILSFRTMDVPKLAVGDVFAIDGQDYEAAVICSDSEGITEIMMEKL